MTAVKNGAAIAQKPQQETKTPPPASVVTLPKIEPVVQKEKLPPLDERLHRLNELFELQGKYNRYTSSQQKLAEFKLKKGSENIRVELYDENTRESFKTSNPDVVKVVIAALGETIATKKKELEPLLNW